MNWAVLFCSLQRINSDLVQWYRTKCSFNRNYLQHLKPISPIKNIDKDTENTFCSRFTDHLQCFIVFDYFILGFHRWFPIDIANYKYQESRFSINRGWLIVFKIYFFYKKIKYFDCKKIIYNESAKKYNLWDKIINLNHYYNYSNG